MDAEKQRLKQMENNRHGLTDLIRIKAKITPEAKEQLKAMVQQINAVNSREGVQTTLELTAGLMVMDGIEVYEERAVVVPVELLEKHLSSLGDIIAGPGLPSAPNSDFDLGVFDRLCGLLARQCPEVPE